MNKADHQHLAWFLGPKAENANLLEDFIVQVLRDYSHWRKNYFPSDPILINKKIKAELEQEHDLLDTKLNELLAQLRRNFPFYSPRYIGHELSDTLISATVGYFAGMLFNPNNVTPEAAPVTAELEIEVCNLILSMLGYTPSPAPPHAEEDAKKYYTEKSKEEFGWAHLTSGGTVANIEALWVARQVKYFPLSVKEIAIDKKLDLTVSLPSMSQKSYERKTTIPIQEVDDYKLLLLKPNESIYLLARYLDAIRKTDGLTADSNVSKKGWTYLEESKYSLSRGFTGTFGEFQPVIFVAGSSHYSVLKAANILGIGQSNVIRIDTDKHFRLDVNHLEACLRQAVEDKKVPLCVIASAGTTEEGAVDPVHSIVRLRKKLEEELDLSFWLHIDAAWGGFIRSLFCLESFDKVEAAAIEISRTLGIDPPQLSPGADNSEVLSWHNRFTERIGHLARHSHKQKKSKKDAEEIDNGDFVNEPAQNKKELQKKRVDRVFAENTISALKKMNESLVTGSYDRYLQELIEIGQRFVDRNTDPPLASFKLDSAGINNWISKFIETKINIGKALIVNYPDKEVFEAFEDFPKAESITVDPHKMGYAPYPAGCIAFKNDRIRSFILQEAPYITSADHNALIHLPPRHTDLKAKGAGKPIMIESFSPFMLEGSKPGAVSAGLWLAYQTIPLIPKRHGLIVKASVLAARTLYERLKRWDDGHEGESVFEFIPLTPRQPDTNIITFVIKPKNTSSLSKTNLLTSKVYETFTIHAELGKREYSYSQPFFISNTKFKDSNYPFSTLQEFFRRCNFKAAEKDYEAEGIVILRATVMNPYILASEEIAEQDFIGLFVEELSKAATQAYSILIKEMIG